MFAGIGLGGVLEGEGDDGADLNDEMRLEERNTPSEHMQRIIDTQRPAAENEDNKRIYVRFITLI
jgi:hypothetical protein